MDKKSICYIFGAGEHYGPPPTSGHSDFVIAADGGLTYLEKYCVAADLIVGDFDSLDAPPDQGPDIVVLPQEKNDTDMEAALREGWERGYRIFHIYGGTGGRLDHTIANIQGIAGLAERGGRGYLFDRDTVITAIKDSFAAFPSTAEGMVSVFSHSDIAIGVNERGLKYPLTDATLYNTYPLGISNEFAGAPASISVESGTLIIIYPGNTQEVFE